MQAYLFTVHGLTNKLLLSLALLLELDEAELGAKFTKVFLCRCLCQDVRQLLSGANGGYTHPAFLDTLTNVVVS